MDDELIGWRYDDGLLQEESDRGMQNKKKVWVQGFSHIMLGLADEPEHGKDLKRRSWKSPQSLDYPCLGELGENGNDANWYSFWDEISIFWVPPIFSF